MTRGRNDPPALAAGPGDWLLAPEGAAIHPGERTAVIADVHLGYEWARAARGDCLPAHSLAETLARLDRLLARAAIARLVVAGDLVETPGPCRRTDADVRGLEAWLERRGVAFVVLRGNHDRRHGPPLPATVEVCGWTVAHGHRPIGAERTVFGHLHPVLRAGALTAPCFLAGPSRIVLPALSPNAAGIHASALLPALGGEAVRCLACVESEVLDFGPLDGLDARLRGG